MQLLFKKNDTFLQCILILTYKNNNICLNNVILTTEIREKPSKGFEYDRNDWYTIPEF